MGVGAATGDGEDVVDLGGGGAAVVAAVAVALQDGVAGAVPRARGDLALGGGLVGGAVAAGGREPPAA